MVIDQDRINKFAEATGDHQWIHLDGERTQRELGMPTIAHGFDPVAAGSQIYKSLPSKA